MIRTLWMTAMGVLLLGLSGCVTSAKITPASTEQIRRLAELRDTSMQYAAWVAREFKPDTAEYKQCQQLYITASSAANAYIESLTFTLSAGGQFSAEEQNQSLQKVLDASDEFLAAARKAVGADKDRGLFLLPVAAELIDMGIKLSGIVSERNQQQRQVLIKALEDKKWKRFDELIR
jgi:hypothetical protein